MLLLLLFVLGTILFVEAAILMVLADAFGIFPVLAVVLVTFLLGLALARAERPNVLVEIRDAWRSLRVPGVQATNGALFVGGAILLAIPGILTDAVGGVLLVPPVRRAVAEAVVRRFQARIPWLPRRSRLLGLPRGG